MHQESLIILFYLKRAKANAKGVCPIICRITFKKQRKQFSTGVFICPEHWSSKEQKATAKEKNNVEINGQLDIISHKINKAFLVLNIQEEEFSVDDIFEKYLNKKDRKSENIISYFKAYLERAKLLIDKDFKEGTWNKFNNVYLNIQKFIRKKYGCQDMALNKLTLSFLEDLEYYYKTEKNFRQITINKEVQRFRKVVRTAVAEGYIDKDPFLLHKPGRVKKEVIFLSREELKKFEEKTFAHPKLQVVSPRP